jgi:hypothetical protein
MPTWPFPTVYVRSDERVEGGGRADEGGGPESIVADPDVNERGRPVSPAPTERLDDGIEMERPWSLAGDARGDDGTPSAARESSGRRELRVSVRYRALDGADGEALERRQNAAIRRALVWLLMHERPDDRGGLG